MNSTELDQRVWVVNGMAYHMREEFVSEKTRTALENYQEARERSIGWKVKYYGALHQEAVRADLQAAYKKLGAVS